ncbi:BTAD domain-containing putative transcriptional regulator [Streptomyces sp. NPDC023998]|uniref:BTAD domain-containing putative transcriptional regulator n=1 Tax=Streptomyces sp. NPDC023998 TaxID=3154597 RepID=UPI0033D4A86C
MPEASGPGCGPLPGAVRFRVLGPLSADADGRVLPLGPHKQQLVLAMLLCRPNALVSVDLLTEAVWDDEPPRTARKNLQVYISALRKLLAEAGMGDRLVHRAGGYLLQLADADLDSLGFRALVRAGREATAGGDLDSAARLLRQARELWAGPPLPELGNSRPVQAEADRLVNRYLAVCEDWAETELELGHAGEVAEAVADLVEEHPLRERLRAAQMTALHHLGRRAEALAAYDGLRQQLSRELGLSPSPALESLYNSILTDRKICTVRPPGTVPARPDPSAHRGSSTLLPPDTADFTGRGIQIRELREAVTSSTGVAVVVGPPGAGKTALAVHVAHRLHDEFPDGQVLVRLRGDDGRPRSLASLTAELTSFAGMQEQMTDDPKRAAALWRAWLAANRALLVLDDAADENCVRLLAPGTGRGSVVVTARTQLAGLAPVVRVEVPPYAMAEALELLGRIIGLGRMRSDPAAAERIVAACGMLPLAVRAAGLKLAVLRHLPLSEYAARFSDPATALDELSVGDIAVRRHVADQWQHLDDSSRSALLRLGPLPPLFTLQEAASALGCAERVALRTIERLIEVGAVAPPAGEMTASDALYAVSYLTHLYVNEMAVRTAGAEQV